MQVVSRATEEDVQALFGSVVALNNARLLSPRRRAFFVGIPLLNQQQEAATATQATAKRRKKWKKV
jgi:hypothetical protein